MFPFPVEMKTGGTEDFIITVTVKDECPSGPPVHGASEECMLEKKV